MPRVSVPGQGSRIAKIALVGEQPGKMEALRGEPFVGPAGRELDECMHTAGLLRQDCYLTNVIKSFDHPITSYCVKPEKKDAYWTAEGHEYVALLKTELSALRLNVVGAVGNVALFALCDRWGITKWRGSILSSTLIPGLKVIPMIHPATVIPPKNVYTNKLLITHDLNRIATHSAYPDLRLTPRHILTRPSAAEVAQVLTHCREAGRAGTIIDYDIEIDMGSKMVTCISFAWDTQHAISIPFIDHNGDTWTPPQEADIWRMIGAILGDATIKKRGQNNTFDCHALLRHYGIRVRGDIHDTMLMQKISMPDYRAGLDFICSMHTDIPYYKADGKMWMRKQIGGWEGFWMYNGTDSIATAASYPSLYRDLEIQGNLQTYDRQRSIIPALVYMMERGISFDVAGATEYKKEVEQKVGELQERLNTLAGGQLNPNSPKQMQAHLYGKLGHKPYLKKGKVTTNDDALIRLKRKGVEEAGLVQELRYLTTKVLGTYIDLEKVSRDGRYRASYNPGGAGTGRLSSAENLFGEGGNIQNWPHDLLRFLRPDPGYIYLGFDLSQAENRIVAQVGRIHEMIKAFEDGVDVHSLTGALLSGLTPEEVKRQDKANEYAPIGDGRHTWRFWGKQCNHALNYDRGYRACAIDWEIPEPSAKWIVESYHRAYPGVRASYHTLVRSMLANGRLVTNLMGRKRLFLDRWGDELFKAAYAQIPQSTVADVINERGLSHIYYNQDMYHEVELLLQIHDNVGFQLPLSIGWERIAAICLSIKKNLEIPLVWHDRSFVIPADLVMGLTLKKEDGVEWKGKGFPLTIDALAGAMEEGYAKLLRSQPS